MTDAIQYPCCYESGHALVRVIIGYKLIRIVPFENPDLCEKMRIMLFHSSLF